MEGLEGRTGATAGINTYERSRLARVWSCFTILTVAALGIFVSSVTSTLLRFNVHLV